MKNQHKKAEIGLQALHVTPVRVTGGVKVCPKPLERIIELANLPGDAQLPDLDFEAFRRKDGIPLAEFLPDAVRLSLLEVWSNPKAWHRTPEEWMEMGKPVLIEKEQAIRFLRAAAGADHYALIRGSRTVLSHITSGADTLPVTTFLKRVGIGKDAKVAWAGDPISDALTDEETEIHYIRRCEECRKFFYAQRENQETCPPEERGKPSRCAGRRRSRQKRQNDKLKRRLENKRANPSATNARISPTPINPSTKGSNDATTV